MEYIRTGVAIQGFVALSTHVAPPVFDAPFDGWHYWKPVMPMSSHTLKVWKDIICDSTVRDIRGVRIPDGLAWVKFPDIEWELQTDIFVQQRFLGLCAEFLRPDDPLNGYIKEHMYNWPCSIISAMDTWVTKKMIQDVAPSSTMDDGFHAPFVMDDVFYVPSACEDHTVDNDRRIADDGTLYKAPHETSVIDGIADVEFWYDDGACCHVYVSDHSSVARVRREVGRVFKGPFTVNTALDHKNTNTYV